MRAYEGEIEKERERERGARYPLISNRTTLGSSCIAVVMETDADHLLPSERWELE